MAKTDRSVGWLIGKARSEVPLQRRQPHIPQSPLSLGRAFPEAIPDPSGCLVITHTAPMPPPPLRSGAATTSLLRELRLVYGIGEQYTVRLREEGFASITDLRGHPRWSAASAKLLASWGTPLDPRAVYRTLSRWLPSTEPLFLRSLGLVPIERLLFLDLETLGLSGAPIFLAAVGRFAGGHFGIRQYLTASLAAEASLLERITAELGDSLALVSYNGKSFDWTVLRERFAYYGFPLPRVSIHIDLLHHVRRAFGGRVPDCNLGTIERNVLSIERSDDLPSAEVPAYYTAYLETGDASYLVPIVRHSRQDLATLAALLDRLLRTDADA